MPIDKLPPAFLDYVRSFDLTAVAQSRGRLVVTDNPSGAEAAWWVRRRDADRLLGAARADGDDVRLAAFKLQLPVTDHEIAIRRVAHRVHQLDVRLDAAQCRRLMRFFNREYKRRRQAAARAGARFAAYPVALGKLRRALVEAIAKGELIDASLIERVFAN